MNEQKLKGPQAAKEVRAIARRLTQLADMLEADEIHHHSGSMCLSEEADTVPDVTSNNPADWGVKRGPLRVTITADVVLRPGPQK